MTAPSKKDRVPLKKSLGQHFLSNPRVAERMVEAAAVGPNDTVLEVGPGAGFLTQTLLKTGTHVLAVETDSRMVETLHERFKREIEHGQLSVRESDIRQIDPVMLGLKDGTYTVVSNIPYFLSGFLFRYFLSSDAQPNCLVFLVQKEIAERIAREKKASLLSLSVRAYGTPEYIQTVRAGSFAPPPKVSSAILRVSNISRKHFKNMDEQFFFDVLHLGFAARRKQLLGNLAKEFDRETLVHVFSTLGISRDVRGEDMSLEIWLALVRALETHRK